MKFDVVIAGAGASGLKALQIFEDLKAAGSTDLNLIGFVDDDPGLAGADYFGYPVLGLPDQLDELARNRQIAVVCPIGDPANRQKMIERFRKLDIAYPNLIHPSAQVSTLARLGQGNILSQNVVIQAGCTVGEFNTFNIASTMGPLAEVENFCTINSHVMLASGSLTRDRCYVGMGAMIRERIELATGTIVGANSFVNAPTEAGSTVVGLPAKPIHSNQQPPSTKRNEN